MNTKGLTLGNCLHSTTDNCCFSKGDFQVELCDLHYIVTYNPKTIVPIPLTEEWLIKSEAINLKKGVFELDRFVLLWRKEYNFWYVVDNLSQQYYTKLEFVHEWQNFYFVMQGKELTINK